MKIETKLSLDKMKKGVSAAPQKKGKPFKEILENPPPPITQPMASFLEAGHSRSLTRIPPSTQHLSALCALGITPSPFPDTAEAIKQEPQISPTISPEMSHIMERVGAEMIIMSSEGIEKTELSFDNTQSYQWLKDCKITIEEYKSAPKIFNIKIIAPPQTLSLIQSHIAEFLSLFQERKFGFSIHRIDMELPPFFVQKTGDEETDQKQGEQ